MEKSHLRHNCDNLKTPLVNTEGKRVSKQNKNGHEVNEVRTQSLQLRYGASVPLSSQVEGPSSHC